MFLFGIFIFFSLRRTDKITSLNLNTNTNSLSKDLEIQPPIEVPIHPNNFTELLLNRANISLAFYKNPTDGKDMRYNTSEEETEEKAIRIQTIRKNAAKMQLLSFLENPGIKDIEKIERIGDPEVAEFISLKQESKSENIRGYRMEAGGFWKDWDDAIFLFL